MKTEKRVAPSAERNKVPILNELRQLLNNDDRVLEIGSGTGQHACYFARELPELSWQPTEMPGELAQIRLWMAEQASANIMQPLELDVTQDVWPLGDREFDFVYTSNTLHIMSENSVQCLFRGVAGLLAAGGRFCAYGPFSFDGRHTATGNVEFDAMLRSGGTGQGVRDMVWLNSLAHSNGLASGSIIEMPSNNFMVVWRASAISKSSRPVANPA